MWFLDSPSKRRFRPRSPRKTIQTLAAWPFANRPGWYGRRGVWWRLRRGWWGGVVVSSVTWFKPWPFHPQTWKVTDHHPKKVTSRLARWWLFHWHFFPNNFRCFIHWLMLHANFWDWGNMYLYQSVWLSFFFKGFFLVYGAYENLYRLEQV